MRQNADIDGLGVNCGYHSTTSELNVSSLDLARVIVSVFHRVQINY